MNKKVCLIVFASAFGLFVVSALIGNMLEPSGDVKTFSPKVRTAVKVFYFALFCVLGFFIVPLAIQFFVTMQIKIGNGDLFLVKWLQAHDLGTVIGVWIMFIIGLCISLPAAIQDGFFK